MAKIEGTFYAYDSYSNHWVNTHRATGMDMGDDPARMAYTTTNISVFVNGMRVGFIQSFNPSEQRQITPVQELGTEGVVQMVPGNTNGGQISISRIALYNSDIWNAMGLTPTGKFTLRDDQINDAAFKRQDSGTYGNPFRTLKDQRVPLEIKTHTILPNISQEAAYVEIYRDCWIQQYQKSIAANNVIITENVTVQYSDLTSQVLLGSGAAVTNTEPNYAG